MCTRNFTVYFTYVMMNWWPQMWGLISFPKEAILTYVCQWANRLCIRYICPTVVSSIIKNYRCSLTYKQLFRVLMTGVNLTSHRLQWLTPTQQNVANTLKCGYDIRVDGITSCKDIKANSKSNNYLCAHFGPDIPEMKTKSVKQLLKILYFNWFQRYYLALFL